MQDIKFYDRDKATFGFMSNFARFPIKIGTTVWKTNEHYYQAQKVDEFDPKSDDYTSKVIVAKTPGEAKKVGRRVPLRADWEMVKDEVMLEVVREKFRQHDKIREKLLGTGDAELIEDSPIDKYWGSGKDGTGKNQLGKILMQVRQEFRNEQQSD